MGEVTRCGLCGSDELDLLLDLGSQPLAEGSASGRAYPLALMQCADCTLAQLSYEVPREEVFPPGHPYSTGNSLALRTHFAALAGQLQAGLPRGAVVVDIGANDGTLLESYDADLTRVAVEPTGQAARIGHGISVYEDFFTPSVAAKILAEHGPADVITACNVLAHVDSPRAVAESVRGMLAPGGVFVAETHDLASITAGLQFDTIYHEHLRYFTAGTLCRLLEEHGLAVTGCEQIATHGGSLRVTARYARGGLASRAKAAAEALGAVLRAVDGPVYGIGATTRAAPLIHFTGIAPLLACVCEVRGSDKIGQQIPGTGIPVVHEARLLTDQPPAALLLSWHLKDHIVPRLRARGYKGKIIVPLPEPGVIDG